MAAFEKGHEKVEGSGRAKGVKNQNTELKQKLRTFAIDNFDEFIRRMNSLEDKDYCNLYKDLLKYNLPTVAAVKFEDSTEATNAFSLIRSLVAYKEEQK